MFGTCTEKVYAMYEDNGSNKGVGKPKKTVSQYLTPVTIMVVETVFSVRLRTLLKVLLDSESTTALINKKMLPYAL